MITVIFNILGLTTYIGDSEQHLSVQRSFYTPETMKHLTEKCCKSDINVLKHCDARLQCFGDYYKKYEHDAVPVKDSTFHSVGANKTRDRESLTNSELEKLEMNIFKNLSQEFQTENSSHTSLESNIKLFKTTVQEIFDNFYESMQDFEVYKKRFNEILENNQKADLADMEDFIKDMIQHIMLSESSLSNESKSNDIRISNDSNMTNENNFYNDSEKNNQSKARRKSVETSIISNIKRNNRVSYSKSPEEVITNVTNSNLDIDNLPMVVEAYKNNDYTTDSTMDDNKIAKCKLHKPQKVLNIYLLRGAPCVQIKMNDRNLLSEINIKETSNTTEDGKYGASAENLKKLAAKELELENYVKQNQINDIGPDREIPVKVSYAKRNIHLNEEFTQDHANDKSFLSKLCNFLCKRFRKL